MKIDDVLRKRILKILNRIPRIYGISSERRFANCHSFPVSDVVVVRPLEPSNYEIRRLKRHFCLADPTGNRSAMRYLVFICVRHRTPIFPVPE